MKFERKTRALFPILLLGASLALPSFLIAGAPDNSNQPDQSQPDQAGVKQDVKTAGKDTKNATEAAGRGVANGSKKAYHATTHATRKVFSKSKNTTKGAVDGAKDGAKQQ
jgi:hypothetical protein